MSELVMDHKNLWREQFEEHVDMPFSRYRAMRRLGVHSRTQRELADLMNIDAPATSVIVGDLESRGLVERRQHPDDGRAKVIEVTEAGREWLAQVRDLPGRAPKMFDALTVTERRELARLLRKLQQNNEA
jgi:DNA-binding MarR family transcriptional regulator